MNIPASAGRSVRVAANHSEGKNRIHGALVWLLAFPLIWEYVPCITHGVFDYGPLIPTDQRAFFFRLSGKARLLQLDLIGNLFEGAVEAAPVDDRIC